MNLAGMRNRPFKYVVTAITGQSKACVILHGDVTVVDKVIVSGSTSEAVGRMVLFDGVVNNWSDEHDGSLSGDDA
jgi:hypothetical protein